MKSFKFFTLLLLAASLTLPAVSSAQSFEKGDVLLSPGIGWGTRVGGSGFFWPNFTFNADFGVHEYVSVGPYAAFAFGKNGVNAFGVGARTSFHWWQLLDNKVEKDLKQDQLDLYLPLWIGARIITNKNGTNNENNGHGSKSSGFDGGLGLGLRWYPNANPRFAVFGEWGRGPISWGTVGATIKVN